MIRILDKNVADKIAAGEVIDRPVSIIKELLENSLDAEASNITVEIRDGGKEYIRVTDNGCGIESGQAELAFTRHATSKISSADDLDAIHTLGFRGEALASICAVSRVEMITKTADARTGRRIAVEGSDIVENSAVGCPDGTTITVRDLFYNVPARRKFLSSANAETRRIVDTVSRISLAYVDVKFTLINNGKKVFSTHGNGNISNAIATVYGNDAVRGLLPVEGNRDGYVLRGFVSAPADSLSSRNRQIFCVNGRIVHSKVMEKGLENAYKEKLFHGRFPAAFLFLSIPAEKVDVNVHPTKREIRFDDSFEVEDLITGCVTKALSVKEAVPQIVQERVTVREERAGYDDPAADHMEERSEGALEMQSVPAEEKPAAASGEKRVRPAVGEQVDIKSLLSNMRADREKSKSKADDTQEISIERPDADPLDLGALTVMGAVFGTYIIAADDEDMYMIDQHAAHERIFYEKLLSQYNSAEKTSQQLMIPMNIGVPANVAAVEETWIGDVVRMGYDIEFFGNNTYIVRTIPAFMDMREAEIFLNDFFSALDDRPDITDRGTLDKIVMRSCKSAVKAGDRLAAEEADALMKQLSGCINPFSCPHGRPTFIRLTKREIEKMFKRI